MSEWEILHVTWNGEKLKLIVTARNLNTHEIRQVQLDAMDIVNLCDLQKRVHQPMSNYEGIHWGVLENKLNEAVALKKELKAADDIVDQMAHYIGKAAPDGTLWEAMADDVDAAQIRWKKLIKDGESNEPSAPIVPQCKFKEEVIGETHESLDAQQSCMIHPKYPDDVIQDPHHPVKRWLLKTPRTEEENQKLVLLAQKFCADRGLSDNFTCLDCDTRYICMLAYDPYSVDGECLLK